MTKEEIIALSIVIIVHLLLILEVIRLDSVQRSFFEDD